jgi:hypothetical protein
MNILHAALAVDLDELVENDFSTIEIKLSLNKKNKTIKVKKLNPGESAYQLIEFQVSRNKYILRAISQDDRRFPSHLRRRALEDSANLRSELEKLVSLSSLSVYRLKSSEEFEVKDRLGKRLISPVDFRLSQLKSELTQYQLELSQSARHISATLQKDVLASILYSENEDSGLNIPKVFDKNKEQTKLISAYSRLGAIDTGIRKKISFHLTSIDDAVHKINSKNKTSVDNFSDVNFAALDAFVRTQKIIGMSLKAEEEINNIYEQINLFIATLRDFIPDKIFSLISGDLFVKHLNDEDIPVDKLSSGEKQLLILLIETLMQRGRPFVYLTDEPELSLHIEWQRKILPAIKKLNPQAQIIAATHSPEVASKYRDSLIDMKGVVNG